MRAFVLTDFGTVPELTDLDLPEPAEGEVRVRVHAASVNGFDIGGRQQLPGGDDGAPVPGRAGQGLRRHRRRPRPRRERLPGRRPGLRCRHQGLPGRRLLRRVRHRRDLGRHRRPARVDRLPHRRALGLAGVGGDRSGRRRRPAAGRRLSWSPAPPAGSATRSCSWPRGPEPTSSPPPASGAEKALVTRARGGHRSSTTPAT